MDKKKLKEIILKQLNEFDADMNAEKFKAKYSNLKGKELKDAFESAYFWSTSSEGKESLRDLINTYDPLKEFASELEDYMKQADAAKGTVNTNPNRQFGASNQHTVRRSGGGFLREHNIYKQNNTNTMTQEQLRMQMLAGIITESQYKSMLAEGIKILDADTMKIEGNDDLKPSDLKPGTIVAKNKSYKDKAELEAYAGKVTTVDVDGKVEWTEKDGTRSGWPNIGDLVLVKNLTW